MSGMTHDEILRDAKEMAVHYPDDRLKFTGREILDFVAPFEARISTLEQENARLREALEKIEEGRGPFSTDQLRFATDTIESMKSIARAALSGVPKEGT